MAELFSCNTFQLLFRFSVQLISNESGCQVNSLWNRDDLARAVLWMLRTEIAPDVGFIIVSFIQILGDVSATKISNYQSICKEVLLQHLAFVHSVRPTRWLFMACLVISSMLAIRQLSLLSCRFWLFRCQLFFANGILLLTFELLSEISNDNVICSIAFSCRRTHSTRKNFERNYTDVEINLSKNLNCLYFFFTQLSHFSVTFHNQSSDFPIISHRIIRAEQKRAKKSSRKCLRAAANWDK